VRGAKSALYIWIVCRYNVNGCWEPPHYTVIVLNIPHCLKYIYMHDVSGILGIMVSVGYNIESEGGGRHKA
jgi:hypothetical protein